MRKRIFTGLFFILVLATASQFADAVAVEIPPPAANAPDKETPSPNIDATSIKPPNFPLQSDGFQEIEDDYDRVASNFDEKQSEMDIEFRPMIDIIEALKASPLAHLTSSVEAEIEFKHLMTHPEKYRGHIVQLFGTLQILEETHVGLHKIWKGQTSNAMGQIVSFRLIDPPPPELKTGRRVKMIGVFMKRFAYLNRNAGEQLTWSPLIYVRNLEPQQDEYQSPGVNPMTKVVSIVICVFVTVGLFVYFYGRMKDKAAVRINHFSRQKREQRGSQSGNFPRPGTKP